MPKASMDENYFPQPWENQVWAAGEFPTVKSEAISEAMRRPAYSHFRRCIGAADTGHHPAPDFGGDNISHLSPAVVVCRDCQSQTVTASGKRDQVDGSTETHPRRLILGALTASAGRAYYRT